MTLENGSEEIADVAAQAHAGAGCGQAREADRVRGEGIELPEVIKQLQVSEQSGWAAPLHSTAASRDELLAVEMFSCPAEVKVMVEDYREDHNRCRCLDPRDGGVQ